MIAVFFKKDFAMIEGDATAQTKNGELHNLEFIDIRRDMTPRGRMMEAPIYIAPEALLRDMSNAKGKIRFWLSAGDPKEVEAEFAASLFSELDAYITETKTVLGALFEDE